MLKERFPNISGPHKEDICYATTNRQLAVKKVAPVVERLDRGRRAETHRNSQAACAEGRRGARAGPIAVLAQTRPSDIDWKSASKAISSLGNHRWRLGAGK